jgi:hypothetical protein
MRYLPYFIFFIVFSMSVKANSSSRIVPPIAVNARINNRPFMDKNLVDSLVAPDLEGMAPVTGKKLSLADKIVLGLIRQRLKRQLQHPVKEVNDKGKTAFILGLTGLLCLFIPYLDVASIPLAILAIVIGSKARKEDRHNRKAMTGIILGTVTLGILLTIGIILLLVINVGPW